MKNCKQGSRGSSLFIKCKVPQVFIKIIYILGVGDHLQLAPRTTTTSAMKRRPITKAAGSTTEELGSDSASITKVLIEDCGDQFVGVKTLVEVAGGTGTMALAIADAFSDVKCAGFDLPHMIEALQKSDKVAYVGGNMFELIPPADLHKIKWGARMERRAVCQDTEQL
ncbi:trans-resveratrol di-O-methyltransferase-like isoform X2 [Iris pallida]|uniref:Trans-resveratrol di-O-methyltransferase-like isoform X2 n=1 Tax=Iris pallida TaxID=29817 RepID=A0AAX6HRW0_IRIPA|nr:trans-resveratrol di-O-methyltransferase-like isoform X2 [Iris pallida]